MATESEFQRVFNEATTLNTALVASISARSDFWLESLKALQKAFVELTEKVNAFKGVDKELANACKLVKDGHDSLSQAIGAHNLYKNQNAKLTRQLQLAQSLNLNLAALVAPVQARPSPNHPDPDKFNGDKTKLEAFVTQLCIKLQKNTDHFVCPGQNTEQNQLSYAISCLEDDTFLQVEP